MQIWDCVVFSKMKGSRWSNLRSSCVNDMRETRKGEVEERRGDFESAFPLWEASLEQKRNIHAARPDDAIWSSGMWCKLCSFVPLRCRERRSEVGSEVGGCVELRKATQSYAGLSGWKKKQVEPKYCKFPISVKYSSCIFTISWICISLFFVTYFAVSYITWCLRVK